MLDLFAGRLGWARAFLALGWTVEAVDLIAPRNYDIPGGCVFLLRDVLDIDARFIRKGGFDFVCASSPCEEFSLFGMKHFHPNPPFPELAIRLFTHTQAICEDAGVPYVMENVRPAQRFVGKAVQHCGPFYLWGTGVPPLMPQGIKKGLDMGWDKATGKRTLHLGRRSSHNSKARAADKAVTATIPPELARCVAEYAERLCANENVV